MMRFKQILMFVSLSFMASTSMVYGQCDAKNQVPLLNPGSWTTTTNNAANGDGVVDRSVVGGGSSIWATTGATQYVDIDLKASYPLTGLVYVPGAKATEVTRASVQVSTNGTTWTDVVPYNTIIPGMTQWGTGEIVREPRVLSFGNTRNARYIRFIVNNTDARHVAELIPLICKTDANLVLGCTNIDKLNSGTNNATTGTRPNQSLDLLWTVVRKNNTISWNTPGNTTTENQFNYNSIVNDVFVPATAITKGSTLWTDSPFGNAKWISYSPDGNDRGPQPLTDTFFYKARFMINDQAFLDDLRLKLDFYADNFVFAIYVNGIKQNNLDNIPGANFQPNGRANTTIPNTNFTIGLNEIVVQVVSFGGVNGFLVQNLANCGGRDYGDLPGSYDESTSGVFTPAYHRVSLNANPNAAANSKYVSRLGGGDIDYEEGPVSSIGADGDNIVSIIAGRINDENGYTLPTVNSFNPASIVIPVTTSNHSGHNAFTYIWLDLNQNGKFEDSERRVSTAVGTGLVNEVRNITFTSPSIRGVSKYVYGRVRTSTDPGFIANPKPIGYGGDGEVEDFRLEINVASGSVSGHVYLNPNNSGVFTGIRTNLNEQLHANLIRGGVVIATVPIDFNGFYTFQGITVGNATVQLTTNKGVIGQAQPVTSLPSNYIYFAEGTGTGDGTPNGSFNVNIVDSTNTTVNYSIKNSIDSDGDGVIDVDDLDDDNDGILDTIECSSYYTLADYNAVTITGAGTTSTSISNIKIGNNTATVSRTSTVSPYWGPVIGDVNLNSASFYNPLNNGMIKAIDEGIRVADGNKFNYTVTLSKPVQYIYMNVWDMDASKIVFTSSNIKEELITGGSEFYYNSNTRELYDINPATVGAPLTNGYGTVRISSRDGSLITSFTYQRLANDGATFTNDGSQYTFALDTPCDFDGDGIPNILDLDSDNDGCSDAIEGGDNVLLSQVGAPSASLSSGNSLSGSNVNIIGYVNANGVPEVVNTGASNTDGQIGQGIGYARDSASNGCVDSDGDGVIDAVDQDDDNDGILDLDECPAINWLADYSSSTVTGGGTHNASLQNIKFSNGITATLTRVANPNTLVTYAYPLSTGADIGMNYAVYTPVVTASVNWIKENINMPNYDTRMSYTLTLSQPVKSIVMHIANWDFMRTQFTGTNQSEVLLSGGSELIYDPATRELYDSDPNSVSTVARDGYGSIKISSKDGSPIQTITFTKRRDPNGNSGSDGTLLTFAIPDICDTDGDGIPNSLDLDSDNDGCLDALEGGDNVQVSQLVNAGGTVSVGTGSNAAIQNLCADGSCVNVNGVPTVVNPGGAADTDNKVGQTVFESQDASKANCIQACYKPGVLSGTILSSNHGITSLSRAGADNSNWPMVRKGAWTVLESKTKGFVPNRLTSEEITGLDEAKLVVGMMVYNTTLHCIQINIDGTKNGWKCFNTQSCPD